MQQPGRTICEPQHICGPDSCVQSSLLKGPDTDSSPLSCRLPTSGSHVFGIQYVSREAKASSVAGRAHLLISDTDHIYNSAPISQYPPFAFFCICCPTHFVVVRVMFLHWQRHNILLWLIFDFFFFFFNLVEN